MSHHLPSNDVLVVTVLDGSGYPSHERWMHIPESGRSAVAGNDLRLNARDLRNVNELLKRRLLDRWAANMRFSLAGVNRRDALAKLLRGISIDACFFAAGDPKPEHITGLLYEQLRDIVKLKRAPRILPDYLVQMDGGFIASVLVDTFDGPFKNGRDALPALERRLGRPGDDLIKWWG